MLDEISIWLVNYRVIQAVMSLWETEEAMQTMLLGAFNMNTLGLKNYVPEYFEMEKQKILSKMMSLSRQEFLVAPFAELCFRAFFAAAYYAMDAYSM